MAIRWQVAFRITLFLALISFQGWGRSPSCAQTPQLRIGPKLNDESAAFDRESFFRVAYKFAEFESEMVRTTGLETDFSGPVVVGELPGVKAASDRAVDSPTVTLASPLESKPKPDPDSEEREQPLAGPKQRTKLDVPASTVATQLPSPAETNIQTPERDDMAPAPVGPPPVTRSSRPRILFQPAVPARDNAGFSILRPTVQLADAPVTEIPATPAHVPELVGELPLDDYGDGRLPIADELEVDQTWVPTEFAAREKALRERRPKPLVRLFRGVKSYVAGQRRRDAGVGAERLPFALFELDASQPNNNFRLRYESAFDWEFPDRVEYLWSRIGGKGPAAPTAPTPVESSVDYQELRLAMEVGGAKFSATTEIPLRLINPTTLANTGGLGDMVITTKTVMVDSDSLQITQIMKTQTPTGTPSKGRGNGHVSMEQGIAARIKYRERLMLHNEMKLWFPLGGEPGFSGPIFRYGFGMAHLLYDSDCFAVIPTLEFAGWSVLNGGQTEDVTVAGVVTGNQIVSIDGVNIINVMPGVRLVRDTGVEVFEFGFSGGTVITSDQWYETMLRMDLRWTF